MVELFLCKATAHQQEESITSSLKPHAIARGRNKKKIHCIIDLPLDHLREIPCSEKVLAYLAEHYGLKTIEDVYRSPKRFLAAIDNKVLRNALLKAKEAMSGNKFVSIKRKYIFDFFYPRKHRKEEQAIRLGIMLFEGVLKSKQASLIELEKRHPKLVKERKEKVKKQASIRYIRKNIDRIAVAI